MQNLPEIFPNKVILLVGSKAVRETVLNLTAVLALRGSVQILDAGNRFDAYSVARQIRRQTHELEAALSNINIARAFTCYQVLALFKQTAVSPTPQIALDLLTTFYDESVSLNESYRLLRLVGQQVQRLRRMAPVVITVRPSPQPERVGLLNLLLEIADYVHIQKEEEIIMQPSLLSL